MATEREDFFGTRAAGLQARLPKVQAEKRQAEVHARGLEAAASVRDRTIPLFAQRDILSIIHGESLREAGLAGRIS